MSASRRRRVVSALLALAIALLIVLLVTDWSNSLLKDLGAVGLVLAALVVAAVVIVMALWHGDYL